MIVREEEGAAGQQLILRLILEDPSRFPRGGLSYSIPEFSTGA